MNSEDIINILVVEDDMATRKLQRRILERGKYQVHEAESGHIALQTLDTQAIDIIIMDILMPEMTGIELLQELKSNPMTSKIPIVLCTSVSDQKYVEEALSLGICGYLLKPIAARELLQKVIKAEKQAAPVLEDPFRTTHKLGLDLDEYQELLYLMIDEAKKSLKEIGSKVEVGDFKEFDRFSRDLSSSAGNFGARALQSAAMEANNALPKVERELREKYMFNLRTQVERLDEAVSRLR